ncbi:Hypothetical predicted protein, partial [Marmota monax]
RDRPSRPRPRSSSKKEPRDRGLPAARTRHRQPRSQPAARRPRQLIDPVLRPLSSFRFRLIFVPLRLPPLPSPRLRPPAPALALLLSRKGRGLWPCGQP